MAEKTIFEKIVDREIPADVVYENDQNIAFLDVLPLDKGHTLIVPKKPYVHIWDMPEDEYISYQKSIFLVVNHMREKLGKDIAVMQRNGKDAGQEVMHVHTHLVPRHTNEKIKPIFNYADLQTKVYESDQEKKEFLELLKIG